jgi:protein-tyrosine phosphatase
VIDLHSHILPGIDDGAPSLDVAVEMARIAVADGIEVMACTPHIYPGLYMNDAAGITTARDALQAVLDERGIPLRLVTGADVHLVPGVIEGLRAGTVPSLHGTRYLLLEPSHQMAPPRFEEQVFNIVANGWVPIITHPERLPWVEDHFETFVALTRHGAWMQLTAGALTGGFGKRPKYWAERFLGEGLTHVLATDAHSTGRRRPVLSEALPIARRLVGEDETVQLVRGRPDAVLRNVPPGEIAQPPEHAPRKGWRSFLGLGN